MAVRYRHTAGAGWSELGGRRYLFFMDVLNIIFWLILFLIFWTYFGYFLMLKVVSILYTKKVNKSEDYPDVSLIITAYNEEARIGQKIENSLALDYPTDKLEIIVVSDGSTDRTREIVRSYSNKGVQLLSIPERHGKHYGQGKGIAIARNDLLVLSDATTFLSRDAVRKIIRSFADPSVGCVSGEDRLKSGESDSSGEGMYVRYEMKLRRLESLVGSLVGVSGCFFAVRRELCRDWIGNMSSDFYLPNIAIINGYRTVVEPEALGYYEVVGKPEKEFERKVRTVVHGMEVLAKFKTVLNPLKYGAYSLQMMSHKVSRWLIPVYLILLMVLNLLLVNHGIIFQILLLAQIIFYLFGGLAFLAKGLQEKFIFKVPFFFMMVNASILVAWYGFLSKKDYVTWESTER